MENCIITSGYKLTCQGVGGVKNVWIGTYDSDINWVYTNGKITGVAPGSAVPSVFKFEQYDEISALNGSGVYGDNRTIAVESSLNIKMDHLDDELILLTESLRRAYVWAIVESNEGVFAVLGADSPGRATADTIGFGQAFTDMNGVDITFTWRSTKGIVPLDGAMIGDEIVVSGDTPVSE